MSRYLGQSVGRSGKTIAIYIAEQVKDKGYYRVVDAIDSTVLNETFERVQTVVQGTKILSTKQEKKVESVLITYVTML